MDISNTILTHPLRDDVSAQLIFVDDQYIPQFSKSSDLVGLAVISDWKTALANYTHLMPNYAPKSAEQGVFCYISREAIIEKPIHILFICTGNSSDIDREFIDEFLNKPSSKLQAKAYGCNNLILANPKSHCKIIVEYLGLGESCPDINVNEKIHIAGQANVTYLTLRHNRIKRNFNSTLEVQQEEFSNFTHGSFVVGGSSGLENINVKLFGQGSCCAINGLNLASDSATSKCQLKIEHMTCETTSYTVFKNIVSNKAHVTFNGLLKVISKAQKSIAHLKNHNLILSDDAEIDTSPELEIYADDVKCTHGSTVGSLDKNMLYYLQLRGISEKEARNLLVQAFANEIMEKIADVNLRKYVKEIMQMS